MSKATFLHREPEDLERYLLEQGRRDRGSKRARDRAIAHASLAATAGAGLAVTSITSGSAAAASAAPWALAAKWVTVGVASAALTVGVAEEWRQSEALPVPSPTATSLSKPATRRPTTTDAIDHGPAIPPDPVIEVAAPATVVDPAIEAPSGVSVASRKSRNERSTPAVEGSSRGSSLADERARSPVEAAPDLAMPSPPGVGVARDGSLPFELRLLDEARRSLQARDGARALTLLDTYTQRFPAGGMRIEASALRIEALFALGQREGAHALGRAFLADHSSSPAAMRVRKLLETGNRPAR